MGTKKVMDGPSWMGFELLSCPCSQRSKKLWHLNRGNQNLIWSCQNLPKVKRICHVARAWATQLKAWRWRPFHTSGKPLPLTLHMVRPELRREKSTSRKFLHMNTTYVSSVRVETTNISQLWGNESERLDPFEVYGIQRKPRKKSKLWRRFYLESFWHNFEDPCLWLRPLSPARRHQAPNSEKTPISTTFLWSDSASVLMKRQTATREATPFSFSHPRKHFIASDAIHHASFNSICFLKSTIFWRRWAINRSRVSTRQSGSC